MNARPHERGTVDIGGKPYSFRAPKAAILLSALINAKGKSEVETQQIVLGAQARSLHSALGDEGWADILERLSADPDDDSLDWPDLQEAFEEIMGNKAAARPTMSSVESLPASPTTPASEERPNQQTLTFGD